MSLSFDNFIMSYVKKNPNEVSFFLYFRNIRDKSYYMIDDICKLLCNSGYECEIGYYNSSRIIKILFKQNSIEHDLSNNAYNLYYQSIAFEIRDLIMDFLYGEYFVVGLFECFEKVWRLHLNTCFCLFDYIETFYNDREHGGHLYKKRSKDKIKEILRKSLNILKIKRRGKTLKIVNNTVNNPYIVDIDVDMYMDCVEEICKELNINYVLA